MCNHKSVRATKPKISDKKGFKEQLTQLHFDEWVLLSEE